MATEPPQPTDENPSQTPTSLFPLNLPHQRPPPTATITATWLTNASFTTDVRVVNDAVSSLYDAPAIPSSPSDDDARPDANARPQYEPVLSSASDRDSDERKEKRKRKTKRRRREGGVLRAYEVAHSSRKPDVKSWSNYGATSSSSLGNKEYFFDSRGDRDNLAFGCLYRMDVARFKHYPTSKSSEFNYHMLSHWNLSKLGLDGDYDVNRLDHELKSKGRYWSAKYAALEQHKNLKRIKVVAPRGPVASFSTDFLPFIDVQVPSPVEESWEDELLRKTREFNKVTREQPYNERNWLAFAEFQDKVSSMQPHKGARLQILEKKISILEKAVELIPDSEELLIALMNAYQSRDSSDVMLGRWEKLLRQHYGNYNLWREFLFVVQADFSKFKVSEIRKMFANAIDALFGACNKEYNQVHHNATKPSSDPVLIQQELGLVNIFISLCRFEWQAGYRELSTSLFQAVLEYNLFSPSLLLTEHGKRRLFEHFWNSKCARIGEDGALGWSSWLEKEEERRQDVALEDPSGEANNGGWTGWFEPRRTDSNESQHDRVEDAVNTDEGEPGIRDVKLTDDDEAILKLLGISANGEADGEVNDVMTWFRWSEEELSRDSDQWMPVRNDEGISHTDRNVDREGDDQLLRVILFEDISEYLFSVRSEEARLLLVYQFIDFYGGRSTQWFSTNSPIWAEKTLSLEALPDSLLDDLKLIHNLLRKSECCQSSVFIESDLGSSENISLRSEMMKFVRNATLLCLPAFPQDYILKEAVLVSEELSNTRMNSDKCPVTPCRALAKNLLKANRQDVLLCGVYAKREAVFGNIDHARKIFDMALSSIEGQQLDFHFNGSLLFLWYAEVELASRSSSISEASARAMHILYCLGCGVKYHPFKCQPTSLQQLRARQGYKDRIVMVHASWARAVIDENSVALICSAALFEELTHGWEAGIDVLNQALSMVLPERRIQNHLFELLFNFYASMLCKQENRSNLAKIWKSVLQGLQMYPSSPKLYSVFVQIGELHTSPHKLRWTMDHYFHKKPSVVLTIFQLSFEIYKGSSDHRVHGIFERALADVKLRNSVIIWRFYLSYEINVACNPPAARRVYFRAIHACPWSKRLWLDGFQKLRYILSAKEMSDLLEVMRDKELNLRTDIYEILLQDGMES